MSTGDSPRREANPRHDTSEVSGSIRHPVDRANRAPRMKRETSLTTLVVAGIVAGAAVQTPTPVARAAPAPEVEYTYDVVVRRHYDFPNNDAIGYGYGICDKVRSGEGYPQVMGEVKHDVSPNDEFAANYLVSNAVGILCPAQIWQLRNSAANYTAPPGA
jgi:hypothetical protein